MDDPGSVASYVFAFRLGERIVVSLVVVLVSLVVTVGFWRSIQKLDFTLTRDKLAAGGNFVLATPVFALLALIGFAWVSFSNPITVAVPAAPPDGSVAVAESGRIEFIGVAPASAAGANVEFERRRALELVRSLNCLVAAAGEPSPRERDALDSIRLGILKPVWPSEWGDFDAFRAWALGRSAAEPAPDATRAFADRHPEC